jgi:heat shock protein HslJ
MKMKTLLLALLLTALALAALPAAAQEGMNAVSFNGIGFTFDASLANNVDISFFFGDPPDLEQPGGPDPAHTEFLLYAGDTVPPSSWEGAGSVRFYAASGLTGYDFPTQQLQALQTLLADRPDLATFMTPTTDIGTNNLPFMPIFPAGQVIRAQAHYVDGAEVAGIAYVTVFRQDVSPFVASEFLYTFQGISTDGSMYVAATFPINATMFPAELPGDFDYEAFSADFENYLNESIAKLNNAQPGEFSVPLNVYDAIISSIDFTAIGQPPAALTPVAVPSLPPAAEVTVEPTVDPALGGLAGTWRLVAYGDPANPTAALAEPPVTLTFAPDGLAGTGGCNTFGGRFVFENDTLAIADVVSTLMACADEAVGQQETVFLTALNTVTNFSFDENGRLLLAYEGGVLVFEPAAA